MVRVSKAVKLSCDRSCFVHGSWWTWRLTLMFVHCYIELIVWFISFKKTKKWNLRKYMAYWALASIVQGFYTYYCRRSCHQQNIQYFVFLFQYEIISYVLLSKEVISYMKHWRWTNFIYEYCHPWAMVIGSIIVLYYIFYNSTFVTCHRSQVCIAPMAPVAVL